MRGAAIFLCEQRSASMAVGGTQIKPIRAGQSHHHCSELFRSSRQIHPWTKRDAVYSLPCILAVVGHTVGVSNGALPRVLAVPL